MVDRLCQPGLQFQHLLHNTFMEMHHLLLLRSIIWTLSIVPRFCKHTVLGDEPSLEMLFLQNLGTMDKVQIIDCSNTAPSSKTFRDEPSLVFFSHCKFTILWTRNLLVQLLLHIWPGTCCYELVMDHLASVAAKIRIFPLCTQPETEIIYGFSLPKHNGMKLLAQVRLICTWHSVVTAA
jgi:hypothetical protein